MKNLKFYEEKLNLSSSSEVFKYFIETLKPNNQHWNYFVNWDKVFENTRKLEINLNILNYLIGKDNFDEELKYLLKENPKIANVFPYLVVRNASNNSSYKILIDYNNKSLKYKDFDFNKNEINEKDIEDYIEFLTKTGFKDIIVNKKIKNLVDYMIGVEAGLDSNGRKNRSGNMMEDITKVFIKDFCESYGFSYLQEATAEKIKSEFGYIVPTDKVKRRYDFVVDTKKELFIFETNFYSGGGSKLKSTAGEYQNLYEILKNKYKFIWITDGYGWNNSTKPLREAFENTDYIFNLNMLENNVLDYILEKNEKV